MNKENKTIRFWNKKVVLVTGAKGFVGFSLAVRLIRLGAKVIGLDQKKISRAGGGGNLISLTGDLRNWEFTRRALNQYPVDIIYHLAAQAIVGDANKNPREVFEANLQGTWNLLEACRVQSRLKAFILASSDKAYGTHAKLPYRENFTLQPQFPYDTSKACAEWIAACYAKTRGLPVVIARLANIYGPGDLHFSRIVPDTLRSLIRGKSPVIRSNGKPERDFIFIEDAVDFYLRLAEKAKKKNVEIFNGGSGKPVRVLELVRTLIRISGKKHLKPRILGKGHLHGEIDRQWLDNTKACRMLGWKPRVTLEEGLRQTFSWYTRLPEL